MHNVKFSILIILCVQYWGIKYIHIVVQTSLPSISRRLSSLQIKTLYH